MKNSLSAMDFFSARLAYEITPEDLAAAMAMGSSSVVVDTRPDSAWNQGHIPGALHIPTDDVADCGPLLPDEDTDIVVYAWGSADHGAARAAITLLQLGYMQVRELSGGFDAWADEGFQVQVESAQVHHLITPLGSPKAG
jgi:rhodanese-related sulfurtransferase